MCTRSRGVGNPAPILTTEGYSDIEKEKRIVPLSNNKYSEENTPKTRICLHFTAGMGNPIQVFEGKIGKSGVAYFIDKHGTLDILFDDRRWSNHLYNHSKTPGKEYYELEKSTIGIEIENWGPLDLVGNNLISWSGRVVCTLDHVSQYLKEDYRGKKYWEKLTDKQIEAIKDLINNLCRLHNIKKEYYGRSTFDGLKKIKSF